MDTDTSTPLEIKGIRRPFSWKRALHTALNACCWSRFDGLYRAPFFPILSRCCGNGLPRMMKSTPFSPAEKGSVPSKQNFAGCLLGRPALALALRLALVVAAFVGSCFFFSGSWSECDHTAGAAASRPLCTFIS